MKRSIIEMILLATIVIYIAFQIRELKDRVKETETELELQDSALYLMYTDYQSQLDSLKKTVEWMK